MTTDHIATRTATVRPESVEEVDLITVLSADSVSSHPSDDCLTVDGEPKRLDKRLHDLVDL